MPSSFFCYKQGILLIRINQPKCSYVIHSEVLLITHYSEVLITSGSFGMPVTIGSLIRDKWLFTFDGELNVFSCKLAAFLDNTVIGRCIII